MSVAFGIVVIIIQMRWDKCEGIDFNAQGIQIADGFTDAAFLGSSNTFRSFTEII